MKCPLLIVMVFAFTLVLEVLLPIRSNITHLLTIVPNFSFFLGLLTESFNEKSKEKLIQVKKDNAAADKILEETRKSIINANLPAIILARIAEASITSPSDIISHIKKHYNMQISPGTVYSVL